MLPLHGMKMVGNDAVRVNEPTTRFCGLREAMPRKYNERAMMWPHCSDANSSPATKFGRLGVALLRLCYSFLENRIWVLQEVGHDHLRDLALALEIGSNASSSSSSSLMLSLKL